MGLRCWFLSALTLAMFLSTMSHAREVIEPKKITSASKLKSGEGALRISVRTQIQTTQTLFVYFVEVKEDGTDGPQVLRLERGAGVPIMGTNMIDPKPTVYRVSAGRYRPYAYAIACEQIPESENAVCSMEMMGVVRAQLPAGFYRTSSPIIEVSAGKLTEAGDFILEYNGEVNGAKVDQGAGYNLRWRPLKSTAGEAFSGLQPAPAVSAESEFRSRIQCDARPAGVLLYIPRQC